jgi:hypothetical protein
VPFCFRRIYPGVNVTILFNCSLTKRNDKLECFQDRFLILD